MEEKNEGRERHNVWFKPEAWRKLCWMKKNSKHKESISDFANDAVLAFKKDELEDCKAAKKRCAQEMAFLEMKEKAIIERRKSERDEELNNVFHAQPEKVIRHAYTELVSSRTIKK